MTRIMTWAFALVMLAGGAAFAAAGCDNPACCQDHSCNMPCCK